MLVEMTKLNNGTESGYKHSEDVELYLAEHILAVQFGLKSPERTEGYNPDYDVSLLTKLKERKITFEIKFTQVSDVNGIPIEYARYNGDPSGITISKSDYYILCSRGFGSKPVGKLRLYSTVEMNQLIKTRIHYELDKKDVQNNVRDLHKVYSPHKGSPGSRNIIFKPKIDEVALDQVWIGNVDHNEGNGTYDLASFSSSIKNIFESQMMKLLGRMTL